MSLNDEVNILIISEAEQPPAPKKKPAPKSEAEQEQPSAPAPEHEQAPQAEELPADDAHDVHPLDQPPVREDPDPMRVMKPIMPDSITPGRGGMPAVRGRDYFDDGEYTHSQAKRKRRQQSPVFDYSDNDPTSRH